MLPALLIACKGEPSPPLPPPPLEQPTLVGSQACLGCHTEQASGWEGSHHALAQRPLGPDERAALLARPDVRADGGDLLLGAEGQRITGALGVDPMWQPLVAAPGGRTQVFDEAWDVDAEEWFSVFADVRAPGDWGHWTGRGMTWNTMCGECHSTGFDKRYDSVSDTYTTTVSEEGVGCEACHGPGSLHAADRTVLLRRPEMTDCAACHSRRSTLSDEPGEDFLDQYALQTLAEPGLYYPDGQILDEVFEYASFRSSVMHREGVGCQDCHDAHSGRLVREGDALCLSCHETHEDFQRHDRHPDGVTACVDCHMPETTYMQRHPRRDHGLIIPDPALTQEAGVPNACERCHDEGTDWVASRAAAWWGSERTERQERARALAGLSGVSGLVAASADPDPYWRASAMGLLADHVSRSEAASRLLVGMRDPDPLVRMKATTALSGRLGVGEPAVLQAFQERLADPVRGVRIQAARSLRQPTPELLTYLDLSADLPGPLYERAVLLMDRDPAAAEPLLERAARYSDGDVEVRMALAIVYSRRSKSAAAEEQLVAVTTLAPELAEGWYMLGLHRSGQGQPDAALVALDRAAALSPQSPNPPFARATILRDQGRVIEARLAAEQAASLGHRQSAALMRSLETTPGSP
ncbi:MAG: HEAT repeat domain-containing protein [Myxococcota bacterium]|nr:HEAT repeat domain-containing protein [Myxococcota bacterium]